MMPDIAEEQKAERAQSAEVQTLVGANGSRQR